MHSWFAAAAIALWLAACNEQTPPATPSGGDSSPSVSTKELDPANFADPWIVDNRWLPLQPGTQMVWEGHALDGKDEISRRVVLTMTDLTKEVDGVRAAIAWERDYTDGQLEEGELIFFAQDVGGNVWLLGEYPEEYEDGEIVKTPAWIAGIGDATAGIAMKANPELDTPSYAQGLGPAVGWNDRGKVVRMGERTCVPLDCYGDVLVIREFSRTEPGAFQLKYYAPGVGSVRVGWGGGAEEEQEVLVLTDLVHLDSQALAEVRAKVFQQETRGYTISPDVYGRTPRSEPAPGS